MTLTTSVHIKRKTLRILASTRARCVAGVRCFASSYPCLLLAVHLDCLGDGEWRAGLRLPNTDTDLTQDTWMKLRNIALEFDWVKKSSVFLKQLLDVDAIPDVATEVRQKTLSLSRAVLHMPITASFLQYDFDYDTLFYVRALNAFSLLLLIAAVRSFQAP